MKEEEIIVGGQAVIEGVMMRTPNAYSVAVRKPNGEIVSKGELLPSLAAKYPILKMPVLRGSALLIFSMILGVKTLNFSANVAMEAEAEAEAAKNQQAADNASKKVEKPRSSVANLMMLLPTLLFSNLDPETEDAQAKASKNAANINVGLNTSKEEEKPKSSAASLLMLAPALLFNVVIFIFLPLAITNFLFLYFRGESLTVGANEGFTWHHILEVAKFYLRPVRPSVAFNFVDGIIRMIFFVGFILLISRMKDIKRVFQYHGAEHKVVYNWESGTALTVENARKMPRQHPRCGTSFLMVVMLVSIVVFSIIKFDLFILNFAARVLLIPLVAGLSYEFIRFSAKCVMKKDGTAPKGNLAATLFAIMTAPGLWLQNITTQEPADDQLEVAIFALKESLAIEGKEVAEPLAAD